MMYSLRKKIKKAQAEATAFDNIRLYSHNFGDFVFYKAINFRPHYLETLAEDKNKDLKVRRQAAEYHIEVLFLQYNTLLYNCERYFHEIINFRLFNEFIVPRFDGKIYDQYLVILMVRSLANVILRRIWVKLLLLRDKTLREEANTIRQKEERQEKQMARLAMSAREQIQQQVEKEMEPKFDLLLAQKVKPHAIRKRENKEPVFKKERNIKRKSSNTPSSASIPTKKLFKKTDPEIQRKPEDNASSLFKFAKEKFGVELLIDQDDRKPAAMKPSGKGSSSFRGAARRSGARNRGGNPSLNFNPGPDIVHTEIRHGTDILVAQNPLILGGGLKKNSSSSNNTPQNINSTTRSGNRSGNQSTTAERRKK